MATTDGIVTQSINDPSTDNNDAEKDHGTVVDVAHAYEVIIYSKQMS